MQKAHTPRAGTPLRRALRALTALGVALLVLVHPTTADALGVGTLPNVLSYVPTGLGILEPLIPAGVTVGGAVVAGGEGALAVGGGVIAGTVLAGGGLMYLSWKLGDQVGTALPCLDCGSATPAVVTHGCPVGTADARAVLISSTGVFAGASVRCIYDTNGGFGFVASPFAVYAHLDTVCPDGSVNPFSQFAIDTTWGRVGAYCSTGLAGVNLRFVDGSVTTTLRYSTSLSDTTSGGASSGPTGEPLAVKTTTTVRNADGSSATTSTLGTAFHATDLTRPPITVPALLPGQTRTGFGATVVPLGTGSTVTPTTLVPPMTLPTTAPLGRPDLSRCVPGGADYPCLLTLTQHLPDGSTKPYDPSIDYNGGSAPVGSFDCAAGGKPVPVTDCQPIYGQAPVRPGTTTTTPTPEPAADGGNCVASGVSFNPVSWVYVPVKCALTWAFVPTSATTAAVAATSADFRSRVPVSWLLETSSFVATSLGGATSPASGCLRFDVDLARLGRYHILDSCNEAEPIVHAVRGLRTITGAAELLAFLGPLAWWAWRSYAPLATPNG